MQLPRKSTIVFVGMLFSISIFASDHLVFDCKVKGKTQIVEVYDGLYDGRPNIYKIVVFRGPDKKISLLRTLKK
ncbi:hypothetical protein OAB57_00050 [Bacteriovoracaceae bacterium]|nr:hypothetical protein [Bacteriovoracaceae bacterium]